MAKLIYPMTEKDFFTMSVCSIHSGDIDPVYPILKQFFDKYNYDKEQRLWGCLLYVYVYNLPWTLELLTSYPSLEIAYKNEIWKYKYLKDIKIGSDRRGIYWSGGLSLILEKLIKYLYPEKTLCNYFDKYIIEENTQSDEDASKFIAINRAIRDLPLGGVWSAFKYSDLITQTSDEIDLRCIDLFVRERLAGVGEAILALCNQDVKNHKWIKDNYRFVTMKLDEWTEEIGLLVEGKVPWKKDFKMSWFETETVLCNYHSIAVGSYYLNMDLDDMYLKLIDKQYKINTITSIDNFILENRLKIFDKDNLVEYNKLQSRINIKKYQIRCNKCEPKKGSLCIK